VNIWIIDDGEYERNAYREDIGGVLPNAKLYVAEDLFDATSFPPPDYLVIDISAICPIGAGSHGAYSPICSVIARFPGVQVLIASAVGRTFAEDVMNDVKAHIPDAHIDIAKWVNSSYHNGVRKYFEDIAAGMKTPC
jgi:hypothetical protein